MAARKSRRRGTRPRRRRSARARARSGLAQRVLVGLSLAALVLCAASVTYSFFARRGGGMLGRFRLEVQNGTAEAGLAGRAARALRAMGVDVVDVGNAPRPFEESVLIARREGADVDALAERIGCRTVVIQVREGALGDAVLILGADHGDLRLDWGHETGLAE